MEVVARLRNLLQERGWSEYRLAKEAGLSQTTITNLFKRNNLPTLPTLEAICRAFDTCPIFYGGRFCGTYSSAKRLIEKVERPSPRAETHHTEAFKCNL